MCVSCSFKLSTCVCRSWVPGGGRYQNTYAVKCCYNGPDANNCGSGTKRERSSSGAPFYNGRHVTQGAAAVRWNRITSSLPKFLQKRVPRKSILGKKCSKNRVSEWRVFREKEYTGEKCLNEEWSEKKSITMKSVLRKKFSDNEFSYKKNILEKKCPKNKMFEWREFREKEYSNEEYSEKKSILMKSVPIIRVFWERVL